MDGKKAEEVVVINDLPLPCVPGSTLLPACRREKAGQKESNAVMDIVFENLRKRCLELLHAHEGPAAATSEEQAEFPMRRVFRATIWMDGEATQVKVVRNPEMSLELEKMGCR